MEEEKRKKEVDSALMGLPRARQRLVSQIMGLGGGHLPVYSSKQVQRTMRHFGIQNSTNHNLNNSPHFKKPLQIINLSQGHGHQHEGLEERPQHYSTVRVVVNCGGKKKTC